MTAFYKYDSLTQTYNDIRILRLVPSNDVEAAVECELFEAHLDPNRPIHPYEALSYVWGDPEDTVPIHVNQRHFQVTANLHAALVQFRSPFINRYLWIDAICINQEDKEEKAQQIQLMYKIYSLARRVLVWLGAATDASGQAFEDIRAAAERQRAAPIRAVEEAAIFALLRRSWFQRLWVDTSWTNEAKH
jgi:hypothetical protein